MTLRPHRNDHSNRCVSAVVPVGDASVGRRSPRRGDEDRLHQDRREHEGPARRRDAAPGTARRRAGERGRDHQRHAGVPHKRADEDPRLQEPTPRAVRDDGDVGPRDERELPCARRGASALELSLFQRLRPRTDFVGEVGLDFSREGQASHRRQIQVFEALLAHSAIRSKVLTVHSRRAEAETIDRLAQAQVPAILHWYSGALKHIERALDAGMCFSVNAAMMRSPTGLRVLAAVPMERILVESDGPYVRAIGRRVGPEDVSGVVSLLGERWGMTSAEAGLRIAQTLETLQSRARWT
jgi:TatD DNase family protein